MTKSEHFSLLRKLFIVLILINFLGGAAFSLITMIDLVRSISEAKPEVSFVSGYAQLFGAAIAGAAISAHVLLSTTSIFEKRQGFDKSFIYVAVGGLILAVILPVLIHLPLEDYLVENGYKICEPKSVIHRGSTTTVYTVDIPTCLDGLGLDYIVVDEENNEVR